MFIIMFQIIIFFTQIYYFVDLCWLKLEISTPFSKVLCELVPETLIHAVMHTSTRQNIYMLSGIDENFNCIYRIMNYITKNF
jgi:hypothetical protein